MQEWNAIGLELAEAGLTETGALHSTGLTEHRKRFEQGQADATMLRRYAADLRGLRDAANAEGAALPTDFWDVCSDAMRKAGLDEYALIHTLAAPEYRPYIAFLCRCFERFTTFKSNNCPADANTPPASGVPTGSEAAVSGREQTAVAAALGLLCESAAYVTEGHVLTMTALRPNLRAEQQAVFLWQQVVAGTNREVPYTHREAYTHSYWGRFNVVEMWRYAQGADISVDEAWGLSGFDARFIRDATNTNQIEHMTITALAQIVLGLPTLFLDLLEDAEWMLRKGTYAASQGDKALNRAVARHFAPLFRAADPRPACDTLEQILAGAAK